jgi:drug/metabolite transporter (DMT)-like permease
METWVIWAILSAAIWGFYSFSFKMIAERNYDTHLATFYSYFIASILIGIGCLMFWNLDDSRPAFFLVILLALLNIWFYTASIHSRVESMRSIDSVIFFPLYKTFWPIIVTAISITIFKESLSISDTLGIVVWITVPLLLLTKTENRIQKNLYRWVMFVFLTVLLTSISSVLPKYTQVASLNIWIFILFSFLFWVIFSYFWYKSHKKKTKRVYNSEWLIKFSFIVWFFHAGAFYSFLRAMEWNLAVAFTINSFSILVPIILSIFFYWEHFNLKKWIVIALSVVSILLFI